MVRFLHILYLTKKAFTKIFGFRILDTTHIALTAHAIYFYLIVNFGNYLVLEAPIWYVCLEIFFLPVVETKHS